MIRNETGDPIMKNLNNTNQFETKSYTFLMPETGCGYSDELFNRVVGGESAKKGAWPWMALLGYRRRMSLKPTFKCGGTIISNRHILTAAHCLIDEL